MSDSKYGAGGRIPGIGPAHCEPTFSLFAMRHLGLFLLIPVLVATTNAQTPQQSSGYPDNSQSTTNADCSDPMMASSPSCTGQNTGQEMNLNPQNGSSSPRTFGTQTQNSNSTYDDTGTRTSRQGQDGTGLTQQIILPPEPLTEFQKFIASTTNQVLPIFGANLFRRVPSTFAPMNMTPGPSDFVICPGD